MVKISKFKNQYRITIPPEIITALGIDVNKEYDWIMDGQGLPAIRERRECTPELKKDLLFAAQGFMSCLI